MLVLRRFSLDENLLFPGVRREIVHRLFTRDPSHEILGSRQAYRIFSSHNPFALADVVEFFRQYHGPTRPTTRAFAALGETDRPALRAALADLWTAHNRAGDPARTQVDAEYLEGDRHPGVTRLTRGCTGRNRQNLSG